MADEYTGLLGSLTPEDRHLGLIGLGLGLLSGIGRTKHEAFSNAIQGGMGGGMGLLQQALAARNQSMQQQIAARKLGLEERQVMTGEKKAAAEEALSKAHGGFYEAQTGQILSNQKALENFFRNRGGGQPQPQQLVPREPGGGLISAANNTGLGQGPSGLGLSIRPNGLGAPMMPQEVQQSTPMGQSTGRPGQPEGVSFNLRDLEGIAGTPYFDKLLSLYNAGQDEVVRGPNGIATWKRSGGEVPGLSPHPFVSPTGGAGQLVRDNSVEGGWRLIAPSGSANVIGAQELAKSQAQARFGQPIRTIDPVTGQERVETPENFALRNTPGLSQQPNNAPGNALFGFQTSAPPKPGSPEYDAYRKVAEATLRGEPSRESVQSNLSPGQVASGLTNEDRIKQALRLREAESQSTKVGEGRGKRQEDLFELANKSQTTASNMRLIANLLGDFEGGKLTPTGMEIASAFNSVGMKIDPNLPNKEAAKSFSNLGALQLRTSMDTNLLPGQMSDPDRRFLVDTAPRLDMSADGRKILVAAHEAIAERAQKTADMAVAYMKKHGKENLDENFFAQMRLYNKSNPVFANVIKEAAILQQKRLK